MSKQILDSTLAGLIEIRSDLRNLQNGNMEIDRQPITDKINQLAVELKAAGAKSEVKQEEAIKEVAPEVTEEVKNPITEIHEVAAENTQPVAEEPIADVKDAKSSAQKATAVKSATKATAASKSTTKAPASKK